MGENTHACCCDHSEEALLKRIGELAAEYRGKEGKSDTGPSYGAGEYMVICLWRSRRS